MPEITYNSSEETGGNLVADKTDLQAAVYEVREFANTLSTKSNEAHSFVKKFDKEYYPPQITVSTNQEYTIDATGAKEAGTGFLDVIVASGTPTLTFTGFTIMQSDLTVTSNQVTLVDSHRYYIAGVKRGSVYEIVNIVDTGVVDVTGPTITSATFASDNSYIDILFSEGVYGASDGSTPAALADFDLTFAAGGGTATGWTASSAKQNDNTAEGSASALAGGETTIRIFGSVTGTADGNESVTVAPIDGASLYDASGNAMDAGESASDNLSSINALLTDLISYYGLGSSPRVDAHGSNDLTNVGNVTVDTTNFVLGFASTKIGLAGYLLGVVDGGMAFGDEDFTISGWIRLDSKTELGAIISKWDATNNDRSYALTYEPSSNSFRFYVSNNGTDSTFVQDTSVADPAIETWYHIVAWHDSVNNEIGISVNGSTPDTLSYSLGVNQNIDDEFVLGLFGYVNETSAKGASLDGNLDEVGIWGRVLTSAEMELLYNSGNGFPYSSFQ